MRLFAGKILAIQCAFLLFLSNTGLVYYYNTCIHSGQTQVSLISKEKEDDCVMETQDVSCCSVEIVDCCKPKISEKQHGCEKSTINYARFNIETLQPGYSQLVDISLVQIIPAIIFPDYLIIFNNWNSQITELWEIDDPPPQLFPSGQTHRILMGSFLC